MSSKEAMKEKIAAVNLRPCDLHGVKDSGYEKGIEKMKFCWRWYDLKPQNRHQGNNDDSPIWARLITLEDCADDDASSKSSSSPLDPNLHPTGKVFPGDLSKPHRCVGMAFCWRWLEFKKDLWVSVCVCLLLLHSCPS